MEPSVPAQNKALSFSANDIDKAIQAREAQVTPAERLNMMAIRIDAGLSRINLAKNPELGKLAAQYSQLAAKISSLAAQVDNGSAIDNLEGQIAELESQVEKCMQTAEKEKLFAAPSNAPQKLKQDPDDFIRQYFGELPVMIDELTILKHQNQRIQQDIRAVHTGHHHFRKTLEIADKLGEKGIPPEGELHPEVKEALEVIEKELELEEKIEEDILREEGASEQEIMAHRKRFRAFINDRIVSIHDTSRDIAIKMQTRYQDASPVIAQAYSNYVIQPIMKFRADYPVYQQNVNAFMQKHAASTRRMSTELWLNGTANMSQAANDLSNRAIETFGAIKSGAIQNAGRLRNIRSAKDVISAVDAMGMDDTLRTLLDQNYVDGCSIAQGLEELRAQKQLITELLTGQRNDAESIRDAARFLGMEKNVKDFIDQINAYRSVNGIQPIETNWLGKVVDRERSSSAMASVPR